MVAPSVLPSVESMTTVAAPDGGQVIISTFPTPTQLRRSKRAYALICWKSAALQRAKHQQEVAMLDQFLVSPEATAVLESIAVHRSDCVSVNVPFHYSAVSNCAAKQANLKTDKVFKLHRSLHQCANRVKHHATVSCDDISTGDAIRPPPPPPLMPKGITCKEIEERLRIMALQPALSHFEDSSFATTPLASVGFQPFVGNGFTWNTHAEEFIPAKPQPHAEEVCPILDVMEYHGDNSCQMDLSSLVLTLSGKDIVDLVDPPFRANTIVDDGSLGIAEWKEPDCNNWNIFIWGHFVKDVLAADRARALRDGVLSVAPGVLCVAPPTIISEESEECPPSPCLLHGQSAQSPIPCPLHGVTTKSVSMVCISACSDMLFELTGMFCTFIGTFIAMLVGCFSAQLRITIWMVQVTFHCIHWSRTRCELNLVTEECPQSVRDIISANSNLAEDGTPVLAKDVESATNKNKSSKRTKAKLRKKKQKAEEDAQDAFVRLAEERFNVFNVLVAEGVLSQAMLVELRCLARAEQNAVDEQALDLLII